MSYRSIYDLDEFYSLNRKEKEYLAKYIKCSETCYLITIGIIFATVVFSLF